MILTLEFTTMNSILSYQGLNKPLFLILIKKINPEELGRSVQLGKSHSMEIISYMQQDTIGVKECWSLKNSQSLK